MLLLGSSLGMSLKMHGCLFVWECTFVCALDDDLSGIIRNDVHFFRDTLSMVLSVKLDWLAIELLEFSVTTRLHLVLGL